MSGILFVHFRRNDSFPQLFDALKHIDHKQRAESEAFAKRSFDLRSGKSAVLIAVIYQTLPG